ncbi:MAG: biotin--[acetyl-CoA-carboxylase] ligase, partial [Anaerolineales bacterium]
MKESDLRHLLSSLPLGGLRYFDSVGSTNDEALAWAAQGAPDLALVAADEQTRGRGRMGRAWLTPPGAALAFSLVLRPHGAEMSDIALMSGLGALALCDVLETHGLAAQIKWPNDVLVNRRKLAGILVEAVWMGERVESVVLGMGVNVLPEAAPPDDQVLFPATSVAGAGAAVDRWALLRDILAALVRRRAELGQPGFIADWARRLAFSGEPVQV